MCPRHPLGRSTCSWIFVASGINSADTPEILLSSRCRQRSLNRITGPGETRRPGDASFCAWKFLFPCISPIPTLTSPIQAYRHECLITVHSWLQHLPMDEGIPVLIMVMNQDWLRQQPKLEHSSDTQESSVFS